MRSLVLLVALLQVLGASGRPLSNAELESLSIRCLAAAVAEVNSLQHVSHLYRATRGSVRRVVPVGLDTIDLQMVFSIKQTVCTRTSGSDPQACAFRSGFFVPSFTCTSRVRVFPTSAQVISLKCGDDSSSSSESSEEIYSRGRNHFTIPLANRVPAPFGSPPPPPPPPVQTDRSLHSPAAEAQSGRGDTFSNFLV